jgi:hypothetical protein
MRLPLSLQLRELLKYRLDHPARGYVADVNIATTERWESNRLRNDAGFVEGWIGPLPSAPAALVESVLQPESF